MAHSCKAAANGPLNGYSIRIVDISNIRFTNQSFSQSWSPQFLIDMVESIVSHVADALAPFWLLMLVIAGINGLIAAWPGANRKISLHV